MNYLYSPLNEVRKFGKEESEKVMETMTSYERKGLEKGKQEGILEVARRLVEKDIPRDIKIETTGLSKEIVEKLELEIRGKNKN